jgi:hypothetical protein
MSTNISDLPGSGPEDLYDEVSHEQVEQYHYKNAMDERNVDINGYDKSEPVYQTSNISSRIKKTTHEDFTVENEVDDKSVFNIFTKEFTKENLLMLIIIYIATLPQADEYTRKFLVMLPFNLIRSPIVVTVIKCLLLVIFLIIIKNYII